VVVAGEETVAGEIQEEDDGEVTIVKPDVNGRELRLVYLEQV
jgi:hypothetical protein